MEFLLSCEIASLLARESSQALSTLKAVWIPTINEYLDTGTDGKRSAAQSIWIANCLQRRDYSLNTFMAF